MVICNYINHNKNQNLFLSVLFTFLLLKIKYITIFVISIDSYAVAKMPALFIAQRFFVGRRAFIYVKQP